MRRAIWLLLVCLVTVGVAWGLMRLGGAVEVRVGETVIGISLPVLLVGLAVLFLVLLALVLAIRALVTWPARARRRRAERNRAKADAALTRALVSLAAGSADAARGEVLRARKLVGDTPQLLLLTAEAERMAGREDAAAEAFQSLAKREDARFLGLRGLLRQAIQRQDWTAAQALAQEAEAAHPGAAWLREERARIAQQRQDWREALTLAAPSTPRAPLAMAAAAQEPDEARKAELEREAFNADPAFAPAVVAHGRRMREAKADKRARAVFEQGWMAAPQPEIAQAYLEETTDPLERVKLAETLVQRNRTHPESRLLLAKLAIEAGLTGRARSELDALVESGGADARTYLLLVELEKLEHGDSPVARNAEAKWLRAATTAAPEPRWRCGQCGKVHEAWKPVCEACNTPGRIAWTTA